jgi:hypothetical protein
MNADEIESTVNRLLQLRNQGVSISDIEKMDAFDTFKTKNRLFFETIVSGSHDPHIFKKMMTMKRKLESGSTQYEVDVKFGKFMAEKYIDPVIKK